MEGRGAMSTILALNQGAPMNFLTRTFTKSASWPEIRLSSPHDKFSDRKSRTNLGLSTLIVGWGWEVGGGALLLLSSSANSLRKGSKPHVYTKHKKSCQDSGCVFKYLIHVWYIIL